MIYKLNNIDSVKIESFKKWINENEVEAKFVDYNEEKLLVTSTSWKGDMKGFPLFDEVVEKVIETKNEYQLCTREFKKENTVIDLGNNIVFGANKTIMIAGPCAIESEMQAMKTAEFLATYGIKVFRAGAFKPRTSPYSFQGLEDEGLRILAKVRQEFGMKIITEVKDQTHLQRVADVADIIQIGTKSMYIFNLLADCGKLDKPIVLKRGFMSTLKEFLLAADFIIGNGNPNVILCERGIRTFETQTRFNLDVCGAALLKELSHLPIMIDPSHAMGRANQVPLVAQSGAALEIDSLIVETHPNPVEAKSDKDQALSFEKFGEMYTKVKAICSAVGRELI